MPLPTESPLWISKDLLSSAKSHVVTGNDDVSVFKPVIGQLSTKLYYVGSL